MVTAAALVFYCGGRGLMSGWFGSYSNWAWSWVALMRQVTFPGYCITISSYAFMWAPWVSIGSVYLLVL
ncbi:uncharacterized protein BDR25DRAFT_304986, partial [Lindgomyces ingoldianus]